MELNTAHQVQAEMAPVHCCQAGWGAWTRMEAPESHRRNVAAPWK